MVQTDGRHSPVRHQSGTSLRLSPQNLPIGPMQHRIPRSEEPAGNFRLMSSPPTRRLRPSQLALLFGVAFAVVVAASGIVAALAQQHDHSDVQREVFLNIPRPVRALFYTVLSVLGLAVAGLFSKRIKNWERGRPGRPAATRKIVGRRLGDFRARVY